MTDLVPVRPGGPEQRGSVREQGHVECTFPVSGAALAVARQVARAICARWPSRDACEAVLLILSELLGNAVKATSGTTVSMRLSWTARRVRIEVADDNPRAPVARHAGPDEEGGRGLWIVEVIAVRWGSFPFGRGKIVWAEVALPA